MVGLVFAVFLIGFGALIWWDMRSSGTSGTPAGVEEFDDLPAGKHVQGAVNYEQSPPAGGPHNPVWQNSEFYEEPVQNENAVHTQEHGAVWITYSADLPQGEKDTIRGLVEGQDCMLASPYEGLDAPIVASAWGTQLRLESADDPDLERFVRSYRIGPQTPEPGAACSGGTANTTT